MPTAAEFAAKITVGDADLDRLNSAVNDAPGTWTTDEGVTVDNLRKRLADIGEAETENINIDVPTDFTRVQTALGDARKYSFTTNYIATVNITSGEEWDDTVVKITGDHTGTLLTSVDDTVVVPSGFTSTDYGMDINNVFGLTIDTVIDMNDSGRGGINALDTSSSLFFTSDGGCINSANNGDDPKGANLMTAGKVVCFWDADEQEGANFSGSSTRGVWATYGANFAGKYCDFSNTGTSRDIGDDHAGLFVSRGATAHADNSNFSGSKMGLRVGRARGNARDSNFTNIDGHAVFAFETGVATVSNGDFSGSGYWTGSVNYSVLYRAGSGSERPQGGGIINAESSTFNDCVGDIAECKGSDSTINIDNSTGTGLLGAVFVISGGLGSARSSSFTAAATCRASQMVQVSNKGEFEGLGVTLNANNQVDHCVRVSDGGIAFLKGATLLGAAVSPLDFGPGGGIIYVQETTFDGVEYFPGGVALGDGAVFNTFDDAVTARTLGFLLSDGKTFNVAGFQFAFKAGEDMVPGLPDVVPVTQVVESKTLYVSPTGTGNGLTVDAPCSINSARHYARGLIGANRSLNLTVQLAAGTYTDPARWNVDGEFWGASDGLLTIQGADAPDGVNTSIISSSTVSGFFKGGERVNNSMQVRFKHLHFSGYTSAPIQMRYNSSCSVIGCTSDAPAGLVSHRHGTLEVLGHEVGTAVADTYRYRIVTVASADWSSVGGSASASVGDVFTCDNTDGDISSLGTVAPLSKVSGFTGDAVVAQNSYFLMGSEKLSGGAAVNRGLWFANATGTAIQISRGSGGGYINGCVFEECQYGIELNRVSRVRTQANWFEGPTHGLIRMDGETCIWNTDTDYPDNLSGASATVPVLQQISMMDQGGEQAPPMKGFFRKARRDITCGPDLPIKQDDYSSGDVAMVKQWTGTRNWSAIASAITGTITNVSQGNIIQFSTDVDDLYDQGNRFAYGTAYKLTTTITSGDVIKIATSGGDFSGTGGPASSIGDEYYVATSNGTAPSGHYVYEDHRGTQSISDGEDYFAMVAGEDYSAVGGPASATLGEAFTATSAGTLSGQEVAIAAEMQVSVGGDGGDTECRIFRIPKWFFLAADTPYLMGSFSFELESSASGSNFPFRIDLGTVTMMSTSDLAKSGSGVDRFAVNWEIHGYHVEKSGGSYRWQIFENGSTNPVVSNASDTGSFNSSMADADADFVSSELWITYQAYDDEFRMVSISTDGAY